MNKSQSCAAFLLAAATLAPAGELAFSDPAQVPPPPAGAVGFPSRAADFDARPGFQRPPPGYGDVAFYWWLGDPLTKERLQWQIDQLAGKGVSGLQINYAHSDKGGRSYGLTYPSDPPLFSEEWWALFGWFLQRAKTEGMAVSLSDYTLGFGQGWYVDEVLKEHPELNGATLQHAALNTDGGQAVAWDLPADPLAVTAYRLNGGRIVPGSGLDLRAKAAGGKLRWDAPAGPWRILAVFPKVAPWSLDPMNARTGPEIIAKFFQRFEDRNPGEGGKGLNFFFSDELEFGVGGNLWTGRFADEFRRRKGYDLTPELPALFEDIGPRTPKVRLDYRDVMVSLSEEGYFRPLFDWHQRRGMIYGCDHGGRGRNVAEFGDYFRTQRWNQGPGSDQPRLSRDVIKAKVAASIAHLYDRPRVWIEGYYGSGWGTSSAQITDATFANFALGYNLLTLHGLYYSTHGGWWEWAPPCNHFHMPYWAHMGEFMDCVQRLSFVLSQGHHRCDVAILYPVAPKEAGLDGDVSVRTAFDLASRLVGAGIDLDFIDFESLARATIEDRELRVSGEAYRVLVLPAMKAVRFSTMEKALQFHRAGGKVVAVGALPEASDRVGREDSELDAMVREVFGATPQPPEQVEARLGTRDYAGAGMVQHRRIGPRDLYLVYGAAKDSESSFRAKGQVERWDPWTGRTEPLPVISQNAEGTRLRMPLASNEAQLIVFSPGTPNLEPAATQTAESVISLDGDWEFQLQPSLDNRFGDYHWPPTPGLIGPEARRLKYTDETSPDPGWQDPKLDDAKWRTVTCGFGPRFWKLGPLPDQAAADEKLAAVTRLDPNSSVEIGGKAFRWEPYEFSWRFGVEGDDAHQGYHGLKAQVADEFIALGALRHGMPSCKREPEAGGTRYYVWTSVQAPQAGIYHVLRGGLLPAKAWINNAPLDPKTRTAPLQPGANSLLLRYDQVGRGYFVFTSRKPSGDTEDDPVFSPAARWIWWPGETEGKASRFFRRGFPLVAMPANARLRITCDNGYQVFLNGREIGRGAAWERVQEYDVTAALRPGANLLAVEARNEGGDGGLIAELSLRGASGTVTRIGADAAWRASPRADSGWREANFNDTAWVPAAVISSFEDSLWAKHPQGPPQRDESPDRVAQTPTNLPWNTALAMRWHHDPAILLFDTQPQNARPAGWYRFVSPPGLRAITIPTRARLRAWADGKELPVVAGPKGIEARVAAPRAEPVVVALRVEQNRGDYGGAAFADYLTLDCGPGRLAPGDWAKAGVLETYSGAAWYRRTVTLPPEQARSRVVLDLGDVVASAEVRVNGESAGIRVAPPWTLDITKHVRPGENRIEILVYNTLANHYVTIPTHYRGATVSGLLGPVALRVTR